MRKIVQLDRIAITSKRMRERGKTVGLVLGSFDVLHMGHINLFRFAKKHCDFLIVGLDNDKTIKLTKGKNRPINNYKRRSEFLSELNLVDYIFQINQTFKSGDEKSFCDIKKLTMTVQPTHIFSSIYCDRLWKEKRDLAKSLGIKFVPDKSKPVTHTSEVVKKLMQQN